MTPCVMAEEQHECVAHLELQLQEALGRISELSELLAERTSAAPVRDRSESSVMGKTDERLVHVMEAATAGSTQDQSRSLGGQSGEGPSGGFLLQQTLTIPPFALGGTTSLHQYLQRFEDHCSRTYSGTLDEALPLLQSLLVGEVGEVFSACGGTETTYVKLKERMLRWLAVQDGHMQQSARIRFDNAKPGPGDDLALFALRLSSLFEDAFPGEDIQSSELLRDRLLQNLPQVIREQLKLDIRYNKAIHNKTLLWDHYLTILQCKKHAVAGLDTTVLAATEETSRRRTSDRSEMASGLYVGAPERDTHGGAIARRPNERWRKKSPHRSPQHESRSEQPMARGRSSDRSSTSCRFCGRRGHTENLCRQKLGLCFACGSSEHFVRDCESCSFTRDPSQREGSAGGSQRRYNRSVSRPRGRRGDGIGSEIHSEGGDISRSPSPVDGVQSDHPGRTRRSGN